MQFSKQFKMIEPDHCLICYQNLDGGGPLGFSTVSKELNAVFILRKIFEVPVESLLDYMVDTEGTNPSEWIRLCDGGGVGGGTCKLMVDKAKRIYKEMLEANRKFRKVKGDIIQFLRRNQKKFKTSGGGCRLDGFGMEITNQTRKFVSEHDYSESLVDPFIGGDCQAEKLLYSSNIVPEIDDDKLLMKIIKEERCPDENDNQETEEDTQDTFFGVGGDDDNDNLVDQFSVSSPSSPANDEDNDKDPLYSDTLTTRRKRGSRKKVNFKKEGVTPRAAVTHNPDGTSISSDGKDQWNCSCGRVYTSSIQLKRHLREATMEESCMYLCPLCGKGFRRRWDVKRHLTKTHGEEDTDKIMEKVRSKKRRKLEEEDSQDSEVPDGEVSSYSGQGEGHTFVEESQKMEDGTEYWKCSCGKIYLGRETLLKHVNEASGEVDGDGDDGRRNLANCEICGVKFMRRFELNRHMKLKHGLDSKVGTGRSGKVEVDEEDDGGDPEKKRRTFRRSEPVGNFEGTHEQVGLVATFEDGTEQWKCSCGKLYASKEAMCRHVKEKNMDRSKWIGCPHCVKSFMRRSLLTRHVNGVHRKKKGKRNDYLSPVKTTEDLDETLEEMDEEEAEETMM